MRGLFGRQLVGALPLPHNVRFSLVTFCTKSQAFRLQLMKVLTVLMLASTSYLFLFRRVPSSQGLSSDLKVRTAGEYWRAVDVYRRYEFDSLENFFPDKILTSSMTKKDISHYLSVLRHGIKIVDSLPRRLTLGVIVQCRGLGKPALFQHQHALEIIFPKMLRDMSASATSDPSGFDLLHNSNSSTTIPPLFYYVEAFPYHAVYCTTKSNNKDPRSSREDWTQRDPYWAQVAEHLVSMPEWGQNMGLDFFAPASHPQLKPSRRHPYATNYLQRLSFLSTDLDVAGSLPKDIIVPYLAEHVSTTRASASLLLFFSGGDNPRLGLRSRLAAHFDALKATAGGEGEGVVYSLSTSAAAAAAPKTAERLAQDDYLTLMASSKFCLVVRGDTSSSRRLFTAIELGCVPVIVSDWIDLPFSRIVDYGKFTLRFAEAVADSPQRVREMVQQLRAVPDAQLQSMRSALAQARRVLLFNHMDGAEQRRKAPTNGSSQSNSRRASVLNPVTLTFIEALLARENECALQTLVKAPLCQRIAAARGKSAK